MSFPIFAAPSGFLLCFFSVMLGGKGAVRVVVHERTFNDPSSAGD